MTDDRDAGTDVPGGAGQVLREVVLTGGPCGGRTLLVRRLVAVLDAAGWTVLVAPEAAALLMGLDGEWDEAMEAEVLDMHRAVRERLVAAARSKGGSRCVVIYDRAEVDGVARVGRAAFDELARERGITTVALRDSYDAVVHLESVSVGWVEWYSSDGVRPESPEVAAAMDAATLRAWLGHPRLVVARAGGDLEAKLARATAAVVGALGLPAPVEIERKWVLDGAPPRDALVGADCESVGIVQTYLHDAADGGERRVRRYDHDGVLTWVACEKRRVDDASRLEHEWDLDEAGAAELLAEADPACRPVVKVRHTFCDQGQVWQLDEVLEPRPCWVLEAELVDAGEHPVPPAWLGEVREVTGERGWSMHQLARGDAGEPGA